MEEHTIDEVYARFDEVLHRLDTMDSLVGRVYDRFNDIDKRFDTLEESHETLKTMLGTITDALMKSNTSLESRVSRLEAMA